MAAPMSETETPQAYRMAHTILNTGNTPTTPWRSRHCAAVQDLRGFGTALLWFHTAPVGFQVGHHCHPGGLSSFDPGCCKESLRFFPVCSEDTP